MRDTEIKDELLSLLDKKVFDPVLEAMPYHYSTERDRRMLEDVKRSAAHEKERFHLQSRTAEDVRNIYLQNLYYETIGEVGKELEDLELPRLRQIRNEFLDMCDKLGI